MRKSLTAAVTALALGLSSFSGIGTALAAGDAAKPADRNWSFEGIFGSYDPGALQRGFQVYNEVCSSCHGLRHVYYRNLKDIGLSEDQIKQIAASYSVPAPPNEDGETHTAEGERITRPAEPKDHFVSPYPNEQAARAVNAGTLPPDLSLITKSRHGGPDYVYALLTGYTGDMQEGKFINKYFKGGIIGMPPPLVEGAVDYADGTKPTLEQMASDVTVFLNWAAEPELEERKSLGVTVLIFLIILTGLLLALKRRIWSRVK